MNHSGSLGYALLIMLIYLWPQKAVHWKPAGARVAGHPRQDWTSQFQSYTKYRHPDGRFRDSLLPAVPKEKQRALCTRFSLIPFKFLRPIRAAHRHAGGP